MKVVITGALGHIGSRLIRYLPEVFADLEIVMIDNLSTQRYGSLFNLPDSARYQFVQADILRADCEPYLEGADAVIHLAAMTHAEESFYDTHEVERQNTHGTERVARACTRMRVPLIFPSTTSVYGTRDGVVDEDCSETNLRPQSPYAASKLMAERMLVRLGEDKGLRYWIFRFGTLYGFSMGMRFHTMVNKFCWQAVMNHPITVWRTAWDQKRPYSDLEDIVRAFAFVLRNRGWERELCNAVTVNSTVREILEIFKLKVPDLTVQEVDSAIMNQLSYDVSSERFKRMGFRFEGNLERGISDILSRLYPAQSLDLNRFGLEMR